MVKPTRTHLCPNLGLKSDPTTALHFASMGNYCHHVSPIEVPKEGHQNIYCLVAEHTNCPIFKTEVVKRMPRKFRAGRRAAGPKKKIRIGVVPVVIGLVLLVLAVYLVPELSGPNGLWERLTRVNTPAVTLTPERVEGVFPTKVGTPTPLQGLKPFCQPPPTWNPYVVSATDTFKKLAVTYARPVEELLRANCRTDENDLTPGDRIYLPELPTSTPTVTPTVTPTNTRVRRTSVKPLPTWTGDYEIIPFTPTPTNTPTPTITPTSTPTLPPM